MLLPTRLIWTLWFFLSKTQLRLIAIEAAARLSMRGAGMIHSEISMYRAYQAQNLALAAPSKSLKLVTPERSHLLFGRNGKTLGLSTSEAGFVRSWYRRWAFIGVTAAQLAVAHKWPLEEQEEDTEELEEGDERKIGLVVQRAVLLDDLLATPISVLEASDPAQEFWQDFADDMQT